MHYQLIPGLAGGSLGHGAGYDIAGIAVVKDDARLRLGNKRQCFFGDIEADFGFRLDATPKITIPNIEAGHAPHQAVAMGEQILQGDVAIGAVHIGNNCAERFSDVQISG